jgi:glycosyltransferase involved in cell wall biosynthesis
MRITFVLPPVNMSGGVRVAAIYGARLRERGHQVVFVSPPREDPPLRRKVRSLLSGRGWPAAPAARSHLDAFDLDHRVLDRARPVTDADVPDADVVIATWWETAEWVSALSAEKGAKVHFVQHHEVFGHLPMDRVRATYRLPMHRIVIARWLRDVMASEYGDRDVDLVPNSVDTLQFHAPPRGKQAVPTVGVLYATDGFKGLEVSLGAIEVVRARLPDLRVVSFGAERPPGRVQLPDWVEFTYSPPQDTLRAFYAQCDAWITASRTEGFNLPAMEAMACRTPVVSTRTGWPEEAVVTGENGVLVDVDDVDGLAAGLEWVLAQADVQWRRLSQNAYETATAGSWEQSTALFEAALRRAAARMANGEPAARTIVTAG